jgi:hypothetical protein
MDCPMDESSDVMRCPTCRAEQSWSDACRRCRCDLRLLREADCYYRASREACLRELRAGRLLSAMERARECLRLVPELPSRRLFAVCALLTGDWPSALREVRIEK